MRRLVPLLLLAGVCATPGVAAADWQWTTWKMSRDEVIAASGGSARPGEYTDERKQQQPWRLGALGTARQYGLDFEAEYFFDAKGKRLHVVRLYLTEPSRCDELPALMRAEHGEPRAQPVALGPLTVTMLKWRNDRFGNSVTLVSVPSFGGYQATCLLRIRPVSEAEL